MYNILFTRTKPELKKEDVQHIREGSVLGFHNDDSGNQIKINILLSDLSKKSNGLEYMVSSHKIDKLDRYLIFFKLFGLFKKIGINIFKLSKNKIKGQKVNFMSEKDVKKNLKLSKFLESLDLFIYLILMDSIGKEA